MAEQYMYVVYCADHTFYTGYTNRLEHRIQQHNRGTGAKYTKNRRPVQLIYAKEFETKSEALKAEYAFKQKSRAQKQLFLQQRGISLTTIKQPYIESLSQEEEL